MCGIAGFFGGAPSPHFSESARHSLAARGPDGSGSWGSQDGTAGLIHTRLAILDLSDAGRQPMERKPRLSDGSLRYTGRDNTCVLVFNGEIYNYRELRSELERSGEVFTSNSDTEVLLRLLAREGEACIQKLAGMFAFAFWDEESGTALLARDPLGIKPLYYRIDGKALAFASDTQILKRDGDNTDPSALRDFFLWGSVPEPATLNAAIRQVPAGHCLRYSSDGIEIGAWTRVDQERTSPLRSTTRISNRSPSRRTREALLETVGRHLVSDVPIGIFLSGGIDSTVILALTREVLGDRADLRTFSIGFEDPAFDESTLARRTAEHFGATHTEWRMTSTEGSAEIPAYLSSVDQPTIDGFNTWCVSKLARREGMKVVLSGLGGDEIFGGYRSFENVPRLYEWHRRLGRLRGTVARVLETLPSGTPLRRLAEFLRGSGGWLEAYHCQRGIFTPLEAWSLAKSLTGECPERVSWEIPELPASPQASVSELELARYMRNQLLRDSDVFSMAHGLELRVPFVDQRFLDSIRLIPVHERIRQGKQLLLDAVPEVPEWIRNQPKRGFRFPFQQWMEGQFGEQLADAQSLSPVPLNYWYRTWAVAVALSVLKR